MSDEEIRALKNAAASSAMEGMPLKEQDIQTITDILDGKLTLQNYLNRMKEKYGGSI